MGIATGEDDWAKGFAAVVSARVVATEGETIDLAKEPREDFGNGDLGSLGRVSSEDKSDASLVG